MLEAGVELSVAMAERCHARFIEREHASVRDKKTYYFRELDRHTMYYVRSRLAMIWRMRNGKVASTAPPPPSAYKVDVGKLSDAESEAVVISSMCFRLFNRMDTFVRWALLVPHVKSPQTASASAWRDALGKLSDTDKDEILRAERTLTEGVSAGAALPAAVTHEMLPGFLNYADGMMSEHIKVFTGQHQVQGARRTREALETLLHEPHALTALTSALRYGDGGAREACAALKRVSIGPFLQYQIYLDLIEPRHSIFRGTPKAATIEAERTTFAQFGPGSLSGAKHFCGSASDLNQEQARIIAAQIVEQGAALLTPTTDLGRRWRAALDGLMPTHAGCTAPGWDMQSVENFLCGAHKAKTPREVLAKLDKRNPWEPNPCTTMEWEELYG